MKTTIVGVVNITPDSFSDGGNFLAPPSAIARVEQLLADGADVIEIGGESTRPGATPVSAEEELRRVLPIIREIVRRHPEARVAVDTVKARVARLAIDAGASIVNDVSGLRLDPQMATVCAESGCRLVLMHSRGTVAEMARYDHAVYPAGVMPAVLDELGAAVRCAVEAGVQPGALLLDPGLGFSKTPAHSIEVLAQLPALVKLGFPVMVGASRKRFIGEITHVRQAAERDDGTTGANVAALMLGATWFRVHNVRAAKHALGVARAVSEAQG